LIAGYFEVIDKPCFARSAGCFRQILFVHQHVDEAALAHVTTTNERKFRSVGRRALVEKGGGFEEGGLQGVRITDYGLRITDDGLIRNP
jgi:hypothetical protein